MYKKGGYAAVSFPIYSQRLDPLKINFFDIATFAGGAGPIFSSTMDLVPSRKTFFCFLIK